MRGGPSKTFEFCGSWLILIQGWEVVRAEHLQQLWKEKYDEWLKRPKSKFSFAETVLLSQPLGGTKGGTGEEATKRPGLSLGSITG